MVKTAYSQDFSAQANGTLLRNVSGFAAINQASTLTADADRWSVNASGQVTCTSNDGGDPGMYVFVHDTGSTDHVQRWTLRTVNDNMRFVIGATNEKNCISLDFGGVTNSWTLHKNVAGVSTQLATGNFNTAGSLNRSVVSGDTLELRTIGTKVHFLISGFPITASGGVDITGVTKGTYAGLGNYFSSGAVLDDCYMAALVANLEFTASHAAYSQEGTAQAFPVFWPASRSQGGRSVPLAGTYVGTAPAALQYRVLNASTRAVLQDWTTATGTTASGGTWTCSAFVSTASSTNPTLQIQVRSTDETDAIAQSTTTTVGLLTMFWGQSNAGTGHESASAYTITNAYSWSTNAGNAWHDSAGGANTSNTAITASILAQASSVPWGVMGYGTSGTYITELLASGAGTTSPNGQYYDDMIVAVQKANGLGYVDLLSWEHGENEAYVPVSSGSASNVYGAPEQAAYSANIDTMLTKLRTQLGRSDAPCLFYIIGWNNEQTVANGGSYTGTDAILQANYIAQRQLLAGFQGSKAGCYIGAHMQDQAMADNFHYVIGGASDGYKERNRRMGLSALKALGLSTTDGRGPIITGATRSGATITLTVNLNGASSIAGTGLTGYEVSTDSFATTKTISSAAVSGSSIVITLAADPAAVVQVRSFALARQPTSPVRAIGTYADTTTIPVEAIYVPITSN